MSTYGQGTALGVRFTPSLVPSAAVENPSPSNLYNRSFFDVNGGVYALKYFKSSRWGIKAGLEFGALPNFVGFDAPRNAFGTGNGGNAQINTWLRSNKHAYAALTMTPTFKVPIKGRFLEISAGPSVRFYNFPKDGFSETSFAFNRAVPYDENDPAAGPPDLRVRITDLDLLYLSFPVSIDYVVRAGKRSQVKFGIMHNISKPLHGEVEVYMYGKMYSGSFRPRTGFWGVNVQFERLSKKASLPYEKRAPAPSVEGRLRKSLFVETYTKPGFVTANFDMRLIKDSNNGFGITVGAGIGNAYLSEAPTNNTSPYERYIALPVGINYIVGQKLHGLEVGTGVSPQIQLQGVRDGLRSSGAIYHGRVGYRFQPIYEGFIGRIAWAPTLERNRILSNYELTLGNVALSVGYSFK